MSELIKDLIRQGDKLFSDRVQLMSLWQEIGDNFYPERADFTVRRSIGTEFADHLMNSYPVMARRDLGNSFSPMLRNTSQEWFSMAVDDELSNVKARQWLEKASKHMRKQMYARKSQFVRATKEGDQDFAAFGNCVISVEMNQDLTGLLYRCWHLRDVAWGENHEGMVDNAHHKWMIKACELIAKYPETVSQEVKDISKDTPLREINCRRVVIPTAMLGNSFAYLGTPIQEPYVAITIDVEHNTQLELVGQKVFPYVIPRWQTVSGSQYGYSPATIVALPDARVIQAMTRVLLDAGEKHVNPPLLGIQDAIRGDVSVYAGGITWADAQYDGRLSEVLQPLNQTAHGVPIGMDQQQQVGMMIAESFYLNKLTLPAPDANMTAYEVSQRVQEYIRQALPIFEPMELEYNGALCETTFDLMMQWNGFGGADQIPQSLHGQDIQFRFESPLHDALERVKGQKFIEAKTMLAEAAALDPSVVHNIDVTATFRDVLSGIGVPAAWIREETKADEMAKADREARQKQQQVADVGAAGVAGQEIGAAAQSFVDAERKAGADGQ